MVSYINEGWWQIFWVSNDWNNGSSANLFLGSCLDGEFERRGERIFENLPQGPGSYKIMNKNVNITNVTNNEPKSSKYDHLEEKWREGWHGEWPNL